MLSANYQVRDAAFITVNALPPAAKVTVFGTAIDLADTPTAAGARLASCEWLLSAPALTTEMLPDTKAMTYSIEASVDAAFTTPITLAGSCIVQTGAGGAGAAAATFRLPIPSDCARYIRAKAISSEDVSDCSSVSMKMELLF
jgi:hypothetical protein